MLRSPAYTRRHALPLLGLSAIALPAALRPVGAGAGRGWCRQDPIVKIDEQTADILLASQRAMRTLATGPVRIVVTVPTGIPTRLVATDPGFGRQGYDVRFAESDELPAERHLLHVQIEVYAPARDGLTGPLPLRVAFTPRGTGRLVPGEATGHANSWVILRTP